ncbi:putative nuclease HARBI1 [Acipenser ruthenus]|uniref:putative nuclease HARBI1 n=1 Tax=Acipenser ruthenus TaxID=7906 RepID=UPI00145C0F74|nr:putative nuclease HARBI1 [Acipenser ruthenus]
MVGCANVFDKHSKALDPCLHFKLHAASLSSHHQGSAGRRHVRVHKPRVLLNMATKKRIAAAASLLTFWRISEIQRRRAAARKRLYLRAIMLLLLSKQEKINMAPSSLLNRHVPVLRVYFEGVNDLSPHFRVSRRTMQRIMSVLREDKNNGWGYDLEILMFMFWLARAASYRVVAASFGVPRSTVHRIIQKVLKKVVRITARVIKLPGPDELAVIGEGFAELAQSREFQLAVGCIDGCHVRIKAPPTNEAPCYFNQKSFYSIQLQAVCNHKGMFVDIFVGYPGSVHDSRILRSSPIYTKSLYPPPGYFLLGDSEYPCLQEPIGILTPYKEPVQNPVQAQYNAEHSRAWSVIERAFGMMTSRWRGIFSKTLEVHYKCAPMVIAACTVLHNICIAEGDLIEVDTEHALLHQQDQHLGEKDDIGSRIVARLSASIDIPPPISEHDYVF